MGKHFESKILPDFKKVEIIDIIKKKLEKKLGVFQVYVFLTQILHKLYLPGPHRHVEKGLLLLYQLVEGKSINGMEDYISYSTFHKNFINIMKKN